MSIKTITKKIEIDAEWLCRQCCEIFKIDPGGIDKYSKLMLFTIAKDICLSAGESISDDSTMDAEGCQVLGEQGLREEPASSDELHIPSIEIQDNGIVTTTLLCARLLVRQRVEHVLPEEKRLIRQIEKMQLAAELMASITAGETTPCDFKNVYKIQKRESAYAHVDDLMFQVARCAFVFSESFCCEVQSLIEDAIPGVADILAIQKIIKALENKEITPFDNESSVIWCERIAQWFRDHVVSVVAVHASRKLIRKYPGQETPFKGNLLKRVIASEAINRLEVLAKRKSYLVDKRAFEQELHDDMRVLDDENMSDSEYRRLITVASSLAYVAVKLLKKNGGWYEDQNGNLLLDLTKAERLSGAA